MFGNDNIPGSEYRLLCDDIAIFGKNWHKSEDLIDIPLGGIYLPHATRVLVAKYSREDTDGFDVEVYMKAFPARCCELVALDTATHDGKEREGYTFIYGSGMEDFTHAMALKISSGMISLKKKE